MKNTLKSVLSFTLISAIFFTCFHVITVNSNAASEDLATKYEDLTASCSGDGVWSADGESISGIVSGTSISIINTPRSGTLTLTNNKAATVYISFNYNITVNTGSVTIGGNTVTGSGTYLSEIPAGESVKIIIASGKGAANSTAIEITDIFFKSKIIFTQEQLITNPSSFVADDVDYVTDVTPTYESTDGSAVTHGTGTIINAVVNGETLSFTLVVDGDLSGDGVCDVIDISLASTYSNNNLSPTIIQIYAATGDETATEITVDDYTQIVNKAVLMYN